MISKSQEVQTLPSLRRHIFESEIKREGFIPGVYKNKVLSGCETIPSLSPGNLFDPVTERDTAQSVLMSRALSMINHGHWTNTAFRAVSLRLAATDPSGCSVRAFEDRFLEFVCSPQNSAIPELKERKTLQDLRMSSETVLTLLSPALPQVPEKELNSILRVLTGRGANDSDYQLVLTICDDEYARFELSRQSPRQRIQMVAESFATLSYAAEPVAKMMNDAQGPLKFIQSKVVLHATPCTLWDNGTPVSSETPRTVADDELIDTHAMIIITPARGLDLAWLRYDQYWGMTCGSSGGVAHNLRHLMSAGNYTLTRITNLFPFLDANLFSGLLSQLKDEDDFKSYLSSHSNWLGPVIHRRKTWLGDTKTVSILSEATSAFRGEEIKNIETLARSMNRCLKELLADSWLGNVQAESFLKFLVVEAINKGVTLENITIDRYGEGSALNYLEKLQRNEGLPTLDLLFEKRGSSGIGLTQAGAEYMRNLIDPSNPYYELGSDSLLIQEIRAQRQPRY